MNAITFFKSMGLKAVKQFLENDNIRTREMHDELKQIVEAFEIIGLFKNLDHAKIELLACETAMYSQILVKLNVGMGYIDTSRVKQAINLVEQCQ